MTQESSLRRLHMQRWLRTSSAIVTTEIIAVQVPRGFNYALHSFNSGHPPWRFALDILNIHVDKGASGPGMREYTMDYHTRKEGSCILVKIRYIYIGQKSLCVHVKEKR